MDALVSYPEAFKPLYSTTQAFLERMEPDLTAGLLFYA